MIFGTVEPARDAHMVHVRKDVKEKWCTAQSRGGRSLQICVDAPLTTTKLGAPMLGLT